MRIYLDHNATSPLRPEAQEAALRAMAHPGNAAAVYTEGREARRIIEEARNEVALLLGADSKNVTFNSGGSEAAATLLAPGFSSKGKLSAERLIVSAIEHSSVLNGGRFTKETTFIAPVTDKTIIDLQALENQLSSAKMPALVMLMLANNETGIIQPVKEVAELVHSHGGYLVSDAVQALGKTHFSLQSTRADAIFVGGHKIGALPGVGAIIRASDEIQLGEPLIRGKKQEGGLRAGMENVPGIASFGAAAKVLHEKGDQERKRLKGLRDFMEGHLSTISPNIVIIGQDQERLCNTSCILVPGRKAETLVIAFDLAGFAVGAGSACSSGKLVPSHVLTAMGRGDAEARSALRISLGWSTTEQDITEFCAEWARLCGQEGSRAASQGHRVPPAA